MVSTRRARSASRCCLAFVLLLAAASQCAAYIEPTQSPPGGLDPSNTPQFVLFTHDDAIQSASLDLMRSLTSGRVFGGCPAVATMFVTTGSGNDCGRVMDLYNSGFEIADHTQTHPSIKGMSNSDLTFEILGARSKLVDCGVPEADIAGFRAPFLSSDIADRTFLYENGFKYDSSLIEEGTGSSLSNGMSARVWPFQMDGGVPINCKWFPDTQVCSVDESYPGMFEVPVWQLIDKDTPYSMDYAGDGVVDVYKLLIDSFDAAYNGNRAPMPIFVHTPWLEANKKDLKRFLDTISDASKYPNVYMVTIRQLLGWMLNPVGADQVTPEALGCGLPGGAPGNVTSAGANATDAVVTLDPSESAPQQGASAQLRDVPVSSPDVPAPVADDSATVNARTVADAFAALGYKVNRRLLK